MSTIITKDEYSVSKVPPGSTKTASYTKSKEPKGKVSCEDSEDQVTIFEKPFLTTKNDSERKSRVSRGEKSKIVSKDNHSILKVPSANPCATGPNASTAEAEEEVHVEKAAKSNGTLLKSCLKPSGRKKPSCSVTWADEKVDGIGFGNLFEVRGMENKKFPETLGGTDVGDDEKMLWFESAEACAIALSQAAEAVASGESDATDAGIFLYALKFVLLKLIFYLDGLTELLTFFFSRVLSHSISSVQSWNYYIATAK